MSRYNMQDLQNIRKFRSQLSADRQALKTRMQELRNSERDAKNEILGEFLERGNFEATHGDVRRIKPRWMGNMDSEMRKVMDAWREECRVYDEARARLIKQKVALLYGLKDRAEDLTQFIAINFRANRKEV